MSVTDYHLVAFSSADSKQIVDGLAVEPAAAVAGNAWVTLDFGSSVSLQTPSALKRKKVVLERVDFFRAGGGSVTNTNGRVADVSGAATGAWATKWLNAATAPGTRVHVTNIELPLYTDTSGKLYFSVGGDALDTFDYTLFFRVAK